MIHFSIFWLIINWRQYIHANYKPIKVTQSVINSLNDYSRVQYLKTFEILKKIEIEFYHDSITKS